MNNISNFYVFVTLFSILVPSEPDTTIECLSSEISCDAGARCYSYHEVCDGIHKCFDHADESDCNEDND